MDKALRKIALLSSPLWLGAVVLAAYWASAGLFSGPVYVGLLLAYVVGTPLAGALSLCRSPNLSVLEKAITCLVYVPTALTIALSIAVRVSGR